MSENKLAFDLLLQWTLRIINAFNNCIRTESKRFRLRNHEDRHKRRAHASTDRAAVVEWAGLESAVPRGKRGRYAIKRNEFKIQESNVRNPGCNLFDDPRINGRLHAQHRTIRNGGRFGFQNINDSIPPAISCNYSASGRVSRFKRGNRAPRGEVCFDGNSRESVLYVHFFFLYFFFVLFFFGRCNFPSVFFFDLVERNPCKGELSGAHHE